MVLPAGRPGSLVGVVGRGGCGGRRLPSLPRWGGAGVRRARRPRGPVGPRPSSLPRARVCIFIHIWAGRQCIGHPHAGQAWVFSACLIRKMLAMYPLAQHTWTWYRIGTCMSFFSGHLAPGRFRQVSGLLGRTGHLHRMAGRHTAGFVASSLVAGRQALGQFFRGPAIICSGS